MKIKISKFQQQNSTYMYVHLEFNVVLEDFSFLNLYYKIMKTNQRLKYYNISTYHVLKLLLIVDTTLRCNSISKCHLCVEYLKN